MIFTFSGTGNSKFVADQLASLLKEEVRTIPDCELTPSESVGLVFPVYAWGIPSIVSEFISGMKAHGAHYVWAVMTCGDDMGYADKVLKKELNAKAGLTLNAAFSVQMPNTYVCLPGFDIDSDSVAGAKVRNTLERLPQIAHHIKERKSITDVVRGAMPYTKTYILRPLFNATLVTDKFFKVTDDCSHCGLCAKECPLNNIKMNTNTTSPVWGGNCTGCLRCYHHCPQQAIQFGSMTRGKGQKQKLTRLLTMFLALILSFCCPSLSFAAGWTAPKCKVSTGLPPYGETIYFYNVNQDMFLTKGARYGTHAALTADIKSALDYTVEKHSTYDLLYSPSAAQSGYLFLSNTSGDVYTDLNTSTYTANSRGAWTLTLQSNNYFRIVYSTVNTSYTSNRGYCLGWNPAAYDKTDAGVQTSTNNSVYTLNPASKNASTYALDWGYVTAADKEEYMARLELYTLLLQADANGVSAGQQGDVYNNTSSTPEEIRDAIELLKVKIAGSADWTSKVVNPSFVGNANGWTVSMSNAQNKGYMVANYTNGSVRISNFVEAWIPSGSYLGAGSIYQIIKDLPDGRYQLQADVIAADQSISGSDGSTVKGVSLIAESDVDYKVEVATVSGLPIHYQLDFLKLGSDLKIGVKVDAGCTANWIAFDNVKLIYYGDAVNDATTISLSPASLTLDLAETAHITVNTNASSKVFNTAIWTSSDETVAIVDKYGNVTANKTGTAVITATSILSDLTGKVTVEVLPNSVDQLVINEIQVANIDMFIDRSFNYGGWIELYNPTNHSVILSGLYISDDAANPLKFRLPSDYGKIPSKGYTNIWFDHYDTGKEFSPEAYKQVDFKLNYEGGTIYLSDASGNILLQQSYPPAIPRTSYARTTDGGSTWMMTGQPTPEATNATSSFATTRLAAPVVDKDACVFSQPFTARVEIPEGAVLRYTLNGSTPTLTNGKTSTGGVFNINAQTTILRLRLFKDGYLPSAVVTRSYIYSDSPKYYLPIVSINTAAENLYDNTIGAWVDGTNGTSGNNNSFSNKNRGWERPVNFEYLVPNDEGEYVVANDQELDFEVCGGWSRHFSPASSFRLKAGKYYEGMNSIDYPVFAQKPYIKNKTLQIRNGGNDHHNRIIDAGLHNILINSGFYIDCQSCQPAHIFVNGEYKFMFNIREPNNKNYGYSNYGIDTDLMDQFELNGSKGYEQKVGDDVVFRQWMSLASQLASNPQDESIYQQICDIVDIDEYTNYMAAQCFIGSSDWITNSNNVKGFRSQLDGKYHLVLMDVDAAFSTRGIIRKLADKLYDSRYDTGKNFLIDIFLNMLQHEGFKRKFIDAFCIVDGSVFDRDLVSKEFTSLANLTSAALAMEGENPTEKANSIISDVNDEHNREVRMNYLSEYFGITESSKLTIEKNIPSGRILINGQEIPTGKFVGTLYPPYTLTATVPSGYKFIGWSLDAGLTILCEDESFALSELRPADGLTALAMYEKLDDRSLLADIATPIKVNEVSASNSVYVNDYAKKNDWFELYNTTDTPLDVAGLYVSDDITLPMKYQIPSYAVDVNTIIPANGHLVVWADKLEATSKLHTNFKLSNAANQMVLLTSSDEFVQNNSAFFTAHPALKDFADGLKYNLHDGDQSVGRYPDGSNTFYLMHRPSIEKNNSLHSYDEVTGIDEGIMAKEQNFKLELAEGWNWVSHPLAESLSVNEFKNSANTILSHTLEAYYSSEFKTMKGMLKTLGSRDMYKVDAAKAATYNYSADFTTDQAINLKSGWNWIGYPVLATQPLSSALAGSRAEEGDVITGQSGFSVYTENEGWVGTLTSLSPGAGYMYRSASAKTIRFNKPTAQVRLRRQAQARTSLEHQYTFSRHAYPNVMNIIATLEMEGTPLLTEHFNIAAYSDGECRGAGEYTDGKLFLTVYGEGSEPLTFKAYDINNEEYSISNTLPFTADVLGTMSSPYILTMGENEVTEIATVATASATTPIAYYTLSGILVSGNKTSLRPGIYLVRMSDGTCKKIFK